MGGYVIFGLILAAFAAPPIALGRLYDAAKQAERADRHTAPGPLIMPRPIVADTREAAELRRKVALRMTGRQP